ncbi:hypothetical protein D3C87_827630 [compost metagenome]
MKSSVVVAKHPLHPMLIPIPIACFVLTLIGDLAYAGTQNPFWYSFSIWTMGIGIIGGLLAAVPGLMDYLTVVPQGLAKRQATTHMVLNVSIVVLFIINLGLRLFTTASTGGLWTLSLALTIIGVLALGYSGWLGGELVFRHRIGVEERGQPEAEGLRVTMAREEAKRVQRRK